MVAKSEMLKEKLYFFFPIVLIGLVIFGTGPFTYPSTEWLILDSIAGDHLFLPSGSRIYQGYPGAVELGRYHVVNGLHLNILAPFPRDLMIYAWGALQALIYLIFGFGVWKLIGINGYSGLGVVGLSLLVISPQFAYAFMHPMLEESILCLSIVYLAYFTSPGRDLNDYLSQIKIFIFATLLILSKITGIIILAPVTLVVLASMSMLRSGRRLVLSAAILLPIILWAYLTEKYKGGLISEDHLSIKNAIDTLTYWIRTDPLLFAVTIVGVIDMTRVRQWAQNGSLRWALTYFSGGLMYMAIAIAFGKHSQYHQGPVYAAYLPFILYKLKELAGGMKVEYPSWISLAGSTLLFIFVYIFQERTVFVAAVLTITVITLSLIPRKLWSPKTIIWALLALGYLVLTYRATRSNILLGVLMAALPLISDRIPNLMTSGYPTPRTIIGSSPHLKWSWRTILGYFVLMICCTVYGLNGINSAIWHLQNRETYLDFISKYDVVAKSADIPIVKFRSFGPSSHAMMHGYTFAKAMIAISGRPMRIYPQDCELIVDYEKIRNQLSQTYATDFNNVLAACDGDLMESATIAVEYSGLEDQAGISGWLRRLLKFKAYDELQDPTPRITILKRKNGQ